MPIPGGGPGVGGTDPNTLSASVTNPNAPAVVGTNAGNNAFGFFSGKNPFGDQPVGVFGRSSDLGAVGFADGPDGTGVAGNTAFGKGTGVHGHTSTGVGVLGTSDNAGPAGRFIGNVEIAGNLTIQNGGDVILADCAEDFEVASDRPDADPGSVMVLDHTGAVRPCCDSYDRRAVGVVSGAGPYRPALVLDRAQASSERLPISLLGKVCCLVDATFGAIQIGDMLTTSTTVGHAMKAADPVKAFGAVIGKALEPLAAGKGLIAILVALQ